MYICNIYIYAYYINMYIILSIYIYIYVYTYICIERERERYTYVYMCVYIHAQLNTYIHVRIYMCIYIYINIRGARCRGTCVSMSFEENTQSAYVISITTTAVKVEAVRRKQQTHIDNNAITTNKPLTRNRMSFRRG